MKGRALLAALVLFTATGAGADSGDWQTDLGRMQIQDLGAPDFTARFSKHHGRVFGRLRGLRMSGNWTQERGEQRCAEPYGGSYYWGSVVLDFDPGFTSFHGARGFCGSQLVETWNGSRAGGVQMPSFVPPPPSRPATPCEQYPLGCGPGYSNPALRGINCEGRTEIGCLCWKDLASKSQCDAYRREKRGY